MSWQALEHKRSNLAIVEYSTISAQVNLGRGGSKDVTALLYAVSAHCIAFDQALRAFEMCMCSL